MQEKDASHVFEKTYQLYLEQIGKLDLPGIAEKMGTSMHDDAVLVKLFGREYHVSPKGIAYPDGEDLIHAEVVVLCKYVLLFPDEQPAGDDWITYKDFKDAAPFVGGFKTNAQAPIAKNFSGKLEQLREACEKLNGKVPDLELSYDLRMKFQALPHVPLLLLFNDADQEFPAETAILFERRAEIFLDMECLAILGWLLSDNLNKCAGNAQHTIM